MVNLKVRIWSAECGKNGKWAYLTEQEARDAMAEAGKWRRKSKYRHGNKREADVYHCAGEQGCGRWHVTSQPTDANRRKRRKRNA